MNSFNDALALLLEKVSPKHSKIEAGYRAESKKSGQYCYNCTMWRSPNKCSAVSGNIEPEGWCKWWKKSHRKNIHKPD